MKNKIVSVIVGIAVIGGGSFYAGMKYGQKNASALRSAGTFSRAQLGTGAANGAGGVRIARGAGGGGFTQGTVIAKDDKSITVKIQTGGSKIVLMSATTPLMKTVSGSSSDVTIGTEVIVSGTSNSDGSITAQSVQIRPTQKAN